MIQSTTAIVHHYARMLSEGSLSPGTETAYIIVTIFLVITSGLAAGLTLGLLSIDKLDLEVIKRSGTPQEQRLAARVEPLIRNPHLLLVSLLLLNSICMEALPIFLDRLLNPILAIAISVTAILIFGEILPQAVCKRHGMAVGARLSWFVRVIIVLAFPVAWPIGKLLDHILGHESVLFRYGFGEYLL
jgi:metal transporter CNNM